MSSLRVFAAFFAAALFSNASFAGVVGNGTPSSCTEQALSTQISSGGTVTFNCGVGPQTIPMTFPLGVGAASKPVIVDGGDTITLDGTGMTAEMLAVFASPSAIPNVTFRHITFANGSISSGLQAGGAIQNFGLLTLDTVTFRNNVAAGGGGAIFQEPCTGCIAPLLTITHCLFDNNGNGAISMEGGHATIEDTTFSNNIAAGGTAVSIYSNSTFTVDVTIDGCTFTGNQGTWSGAVAVELLNSGSGVRITNSTFTGNSVTGTGQGSAIYIGAQPVAITNCTFSGNTAPSGGGAIYFNTRATSVNNSIVSANAGGNCAYGAGGTFSGGHNLQFGDSTCTGMPVADPLLNPLANNGGPTRTMALSAGSPAADAADGSFAPVTDQRGYTRNGKADIGAYELGGTAPAGGTAPPPSKHRAAGH